MKPAAQLYGAQAFFSETIGVPVGLKYIQFA